MYENELAVALKAAHMAGNLISEVYKTLKPHENAPADLTTETDRQSQEMILKVLRKEFPLDSLCGEEKTETLSESPNSSSRTWVVDPIDGTRGFAMKNDQFSVMIALIDNGNVVVGVVHEPATGKTTYASKGNGCFLMKPHKETVPCKVRSCGSLGDSILVQSHAKPGKISKAASAFSPKSVIETYSAGLKMAIVARGEADIYANNYSAFHDWDICAGHILVEEAGGQITDFSGSPISYGAVGFKQTKGMLATNGKIHPHALSKTHGLLES